MFWITPELARDRRDALIHDLEASRRAAQDATPRAIRRALGFTLVGIGRRLIGPPPPSPTASDCL